jgi:hypothetical protein
MNPSTLKASIVNQSGPLQTIAQLRPFINVFVKQSRLDVPGRASFFMREALENIEMNATELAKASESAPSTASNTAVPMVKSLSGLAKALDCQSALKEQAGRAREVAWDINTQTRFVALGRTPHKPKLVKSLQDASAFVALLKDISGKLIGGVHEEFSKNAPAQATAADSRANTPFGQPKGQPYRRLNLTEVPGRPALDKLAMSVISSGSDALRGLFSGHLDGRGAAWAPE